MPAPLSDELRAAILEDIRAGQDSARAIARKHHVAPSTVTNIAKAFQVTDAFERAQTEKATRASSIDAKAARAKLALDLLEDAQRIRERIWGPYTVHMMGPDGPEFLTLKQPPLRDQQSGFTALAIAVDKHVALDRFDSGDGNEAGRTMVNDLFIALQSAHAQIVAEDAAQDIDPLTGQPITPGPRLPDAQGPGDA